MSFEGELGKLYEQPFFAQGFEGHSSLSFLERRMVEHSGVEPLTSSMPLKRSTN